MRTLESIADRESIVQRISALTPSDRRLWGKMSVHQMVCHLCDSYRAALGEKPVSAATGFLPRPVMKWLALRAPMKWPKGVPTPSRGGAGCWRNGSELSSRSDRAGLLALVGAVLRRSPVRSIRFSSDIRIDERGGMDALGLPTRRSPSAAVRPVEVRLPYVQFAKKNRSSANAITTRHEAQTPVHPCMRHA